MKKKLTITIISLFTLMLSCSSSFAVDDTVISFEGEAEKFIIEEGKSQGFEDMMPGEKREVTVKLNNNDKDTMDFFMSAEIIDNIAQKGNKDAVYDFTIARNGELFFSTIIGATGNTIGEEYLTDDNNIKLATLSKNEACSVTVALTLDGDSTENAYMNQAGSIKLNFLVGTPENTTTTQTIIQRVIQYVKTGDNVPIMLISGLMIISGIGIIVVFKKKKGSNENE